MRGGNNFSLPPSTTTHLGHEDDGTWLGLCMCVCVQYAASGVVVVVVASTYLSSKASRPVHPSPPPLSQSLNLLRPFSSFDVFLKPPSLLFDKAPLSKSVNLYTRSRPFQVRNFGDLGG